MKILVVSEGPVREYALEISDAAELIDYSSDINVLGSGVYYTSLSDLGSVDLLYKVIDACDEVTYLPSNGAPNEEMLVNVCLQFINRKTIKNIESKVDPFLSNSILSLEGKRESTEPQLWVAGDSRVYGIGVNDDQRVGNLLSQGLDLSLTTLAFRGTDATWAADQILRSDIQANDTVVWVLTEHHRFTTIDEHGELIRVNPYYYDKWRKQLEGLFSIDFLANEPMQLYRYISSVYQVQNFCQKVGAKLVVVYLDNSPLMLQQFRDLPNFINLSGNNFHVDIGSDGIHPGPETHKKYANEILKFLETL